MLIPDLLSLKAKLIVLGVVAAIASAGTGYAALKIHNWRVDNLEAAWQKKREQAVEDAKAAVQKVCDDNNAITKGTTDALNSRLNDSTSRYVKLLRTIEACDHKPFPAGTGQPSDGKTTGTVPFVQVPTLDGLAAGFNVDNQAVQLIGLQDTVAAIYKAFGQADKLPPEYR